MLLVDKVCSHCDVYIMLNPGGIVCPECPFCRSFFTFQELCYKMSMNRSSVPLTPELKTVFKKKSLLSARLLK